MVAMDVVDTLRHRDLIVDRELDSEGRRQRLIARLRDIYTAQGIEVSDAALSAGVNALEEDRFSYTPTTGGFSVKLARLYVSRRRWFKPLAVGAVAVPGRGGACVFFACLLGSSPLVARPRGDDT